jgi:hypothetical protein
MPQRAVLASDGMLYITYTDQPGPNGVSEGAVWQYNTESGLWTAVNPPAGRGGFGGIAVDPRHPQTLVVSTLDRWRPRDEIYRSTDGGSSWTSLTDNAIWNSSSAPYAATYRPHWIGDIEIDPFNGNNAWFGTGYGFYSTTDLTDADAGKPVTFCFADKGLEETVVTGLKCPPTGVPLLSTVGDQDGFRHDSVGVSPASGKFSPSYGSDNAIDFAASSPFFLVRTYNSAAGNYASYSKDQGLTWTAFASYPVGTKGGGTVAVAASAATVVWSPRGGAVSYTTDNGGAWNACTGIPSGVATVADRVNAQKFYAYDAMNGDFLVSVNAGASFRKSAASLPSLPGHELWQGSVTAVFEREGDIWLTAGAGGLFHSTNSGKNFTQIAHVTYAVKVAVGKAYSGTSYPTVYLVGEINYVYGFYRSTNAGSTWVRINDDGHQFGSINALAADPNLFGRVYVGTGGRGIVYGDDTTVGVASSAKVQVIP